VKKRAEGYDFLEHPDQARIEVPIRQSPVRCAISVRDEDRRALCGPSGCRLIFEDVVVPENAALRFGVGADDSTRRVILEGVSFDILLVDRNSKEHTIYLRILNPGENPDDRRWLEEIFPLRALGYVK